MRSSVAEGRFLFLVVSNCCEVIGGFLQDQVDKIATTGLGQLLRAIQGCRMNGVSIPRFNCLHTECHGADLSR